MSTVNRQGNFEPVRDILNVKTRDVVLADPTLMDPTNAVALVDGEWMTEDTAGKAVRAAAIGTPGTQATIPSWPHWMEKGRYDARAQGEPKSLWVWGEFAEFNTRIFDASANIGNGDPITFFMQPVKVATITIGARNYVGLVGHGGAVADTTIIVGYVSKLPALNGGKLRIRFGHIY